MPPPIDHGFAALHWWPTGHIPPATWVFGSPSLAPTPFMPPAVSPSSFSAHNYPGRVGGSRSQGARNLCRHEIASPIDLRDSSAQPERYPYVQFSGAGISAHSASFNRAAEGGWIVRAAVRGDRH